MNGRLLISRRVALFGAAFTLQVARATAEAPSDRYMIDESTVNDTKTKLTWQRAPDFSPRTWTDADQYCKLLELSGKGWRLPSAKELMTLIDESRWGPAIDPIAFPNTPPDYFWSSSFVASFPSFAWTVSFDRGEASFFDIEELAIPRCVR